jgi:crotonobetaine/carnitine-CoA ligase
MMKQHAQPARELLPGEVLALYPPHDETIGALLRSRAAVAPDRLLLMFDERHWSYRQVDLATDLLARSLLRQGIGHGDHVAIAAPNSDIVLLAFVAVAKLGGLFIPLNPGQTDGELSYMLHHCRPKAVLGPAEELPRLAALLGDADPAPVILSLDDFGAGAATPDEVLALLAKTAGPGPAPDLPKVAAGDPAVVIYTSGTTGYPKGVVHSQRNYVLAAEAFVERMHLQPSDRLLTVLPFFHINALFYSWGGSLAAGAALVTTAKFSASRLWQLAANTGATQFNILAAVGNILAKRPRGEFEPSHRIRRIYGGPISAEMFRVFQHEFHVPTLIEGYGMSEIPGACNNPFEGPLKVGSIGKPARHPRLGAFVECKVVDEEGRELAAGEIGELLVKTPIVTLGYLDDPAQTAAAIKDGWFWTGDYVRRDEEGYYFFIARKRDIIRRRGENISGAELDRVLSEHPNVLEAATIGVDAELGDEEIMAVVVAKSQPAPKPEELVAWCADRLAAMKIPRYFVFTDALPHTSSHRVAKFRLKQDASLRGRAWDREAQAK